MRACRFLLFFSFLLPFAVSAHAAETPAEHAANVYAAQQVASHPLHGNIPDYSLPPDNLAKAQHLSTIGTTLHFVEIAWSILSLLLLLWSGAIAWMRDRAVARRKSRFAQAYFFMRYFLLASTLLSLPLEIYSHHLSLAYGFSVQGWGSWALDLLKPLVLVWLGGTLIVLLLFWIIRKLPRTWWLVFSCVWSLVVLLGFYGAPAFSALFYKHEPLQQSHPELVTQLERVVAKGHMDIPPERMFLMKASAKVTTLNADVEGFGSSKRVVVWDTTIAKATPDEILFIFGHESGHYVLGHLVQGLIFSIAGSFFGLFLGFLFVRWSLRRFGSTWRIPDQNDWGTLPVLLLAVSLLSALSEPLYNTMIRSHEHAADVYGQEAVHGIVADPQVSGKNAFDVLGETSLSDPNPSPFYEFWTYSHPAIGRRAAFAHAYNPWAPGSEPKYFAKDSK